MRWREGRRNAREGRRDARPGRGRRRMEEGNRGGRKGVVAHVSVTGHLCFISELINLPTLVFNWHENIRIENS